MWSKCRSQKNRTLKRFNEVVTVIIGFTGQGKSTLASHIARKSPTRVIFDPRSQFDSSPLRVTDAASLYELLDDEPEIVIQPGRAQELEAAFDSTCSELANWIEDNPREVVCLVVDEGRLVGLDSKSTSLNFDWIVRSAREGSPIDVIITCHRPVDVSTNVRAISNRLVFFRVMLPNDLATIEDQCGPDVAEQVRILGEREFITWNNSRQQWRKITDTSSWFVRISEGEAIGHH